MIIYAYLLQVVDNLLNLSYMQYTNKDAHYLYCKSCTPCIKAEVKQYQSDRSYMFFISDRLACVHTYMITHLEMQICV